MSRTTAPRHTVEFCRQKARTVTAIVPEKVQTLWQGLLPHFASTERLVVAVARELIRRLPRAAARADISPSML